MAIRQVGVLSPEIQGLKKLATRVVCQGENSMENSMSGCSSLVIATCGLGVVVLEFLVLLKGAPESCADEYRSAIIYKSVPGLLNVVNETIF